MAVKLEDQALAARNFVLGSDVFVMLLTPGERVRKVVLCFTSMCLKVGHQLR